MQTDVLETAWSGLDQSREPDNLPQGAVQQADNLVLDGPDLLTRPGLQAVLTSAHSSGIYAYTPILSILGGEKGLYCADSALYYWAGSTSASSVSGTGTVAQASAQMALTPGAAFLVDGAMNLTRVAFDSSGAPTGAAAVTQLDRPDGTITAEPAITTERLIVAGSQTWTQNYVTGSMLFTDTVAVGSSGAGDVCAPLSAISFEEGNFWKGTDNPYALWAKTTGDATFSTRVSTSNGSNCVELDSDDYSNTGPDGVISDPLTLNAKSASGYARLFVMEYEAEPEDVSTTSEVVDMIIRPYDSAPAQITDPSTSAAIETRFRSPMLPVSQSTRVSNLVDLRHLSTEPRSITVEFMQPFGRDTNKGANVNRVKMLVPQMKLDTLVESDRRVTVRQGTVQTWQGMGTVAEGSGSVDKNTTPTSRVTQGRLLTQGLYLESGTLSPTIDLSKTRTLALEVLPGAGVTGLQIRLQLKQSSTWYLTETLDIPLEGGWATVDLTVLKQSGSTTTVAGSALTAVSAVRVEIVNDVLIESLQEQGTSTVFRFGDLKEAGNLLVGRDYWYVLAEVDDNGDSQYIDIIHSDGSVPTTAIQPTEGHRMIKITLPARKNSGAEFLALYRFGGSFLPQEGAPELPTGRLLCWIDWSAATFAQGGDTQKPTSPTSGYPVVFANPYVSWTKTGSTGSSGSILIDNTPDSWLSGADNYMSGREKAPTAPVSVAYWDSRLWTAKDADVYASWLIEPGRSSGIYWTRIAEPTVTDPEANKKGWWARLHLRPGDTIKKLLPVGSGDAPNLLVLTRYSAFVVSRGGQEKYSVRELKGADVGGVVSIYAATSWDEAAYWLSDRGLLRWQPGSSEVELVGDKVRRLLPGVSPGMTYHATGLSRCSLAPSHHHLYLSVPQSSTDQTPNSSLVWHQREKGWTRWLKGFTGGFGDILAGFDGQLWRVTGSGDKATPSSGASAVSITLRTRRVGEGIWLSRPGRVFHSLYLPGSTNATLTYTLMGNGTTNGTQTQVILGEVADRFRMSVTGRGNRHDLTMATSSIERLRVRGLGWELIPERKA